MLSAFKSAPHFPASLSIAERAALLACAGPLCTQTGQHLRRIRVTGRVRPCFPRESLSPPRRYVFHRPPLKVQYGKLCLYLLGMEDQTKMVGVANPETFQTGALMLHPD